MTVQLIHTCVRVLDIDKSMAFYRALGFEERGRLNFDTAFNVYMGLPNGGDSLELTVNEDRSDPYDLGDGYNHVAVTVADLGAFLVELAEKGIEPEKAPFHPGGREEYTICFVTDPDGYRIELIDGGAFPTPQDPPKS
jgi:lactoylglutathione lyase